MTLIEFIQAHPEVADQARNLARLETAGMKDATVETVSSRIFMAYLHGFRAAKEEKPVITQTKEERQLTLTRDQRKAARKTWDTYIRMKVKERPDHHLLYLLLMDKDPRKAFSPVQNEEKAAHLKGAGRDRDYKLQEACAKLKAELINPFRSKGREVIHLKGVWYTDENAGRPGPTVRHWHHLPEEPENALTFPNSPEITQALLDKIAILQGKS